MTSFTVALLLIILVITCISTYFAWRATNHAANDGLFKNLSDQIARDLARIEVVFKDELSRGREESTSTAKNQREELQNSLKIFGDTVSGALDKFERRQREIGESSEKRLTAMTETLDRKLSQLQEHNDKKLEEMRTTVDEKLQKTLNDRLSESFRQVSANLEAVNQGLGEMKSLASGVGDLKRVLSNVKTRGILGEIQLGNILEQILPPSQYDKDIATKPDSRDRVEFAVKLPGRDGVGGAPVYLPIDSKFPLEPYHALLDAYDTGQAELVKVASKNLEASIKKFAKDIRDKYIEPPSTMDFGILFLPIEGLYAEIVRQPALFETLQRDYRIIVAGPTTLAAFLNSLQMGFKTLAFEKRSHEIRELLGAVKKEFGTFSGVLDSVRKKISGAGDDLDTLVGTRTKAIQRKLRDVEEVPEERTRLIMGGVQEMSDTEELLDV